LEQAGAEVTAAASASVALQILSQSKPDILLSDIGMPEMDGYLLMRQVRSLASEQENNIPAIALTAYAGEMNQQQALAAGFQRHITKPVAPETLVQEIENLVSCI
jgi:CheY-like chemotaxis protein